MPISFNYVTKVTLILFPISCLILFISYVFISTVFYGGGIYGLEDIQSSNTNVRKDVIFAATSAIATALGIFSKFLYDHLLLTQGGVPSKATKGVRPLRSVLISLILTPVVLGSFLNNLIAIESAVFSAIVAYQNGFFFQTVIGGLDKNP